MRRDEPALLRVAPYYGILRDMAANRGRFKKGEHWRKPKPHWEREWLRIEYCEKGRSAGDIAVQAGCTECNIYFWLKKHGIPRRSISEARAKKHWGASGSANPMYGRRGAENPHWRGGVDPGTAGSLFVA